MGLLLEFVLFLIEFVHFIERSVPSLVHGQKDLKLSRVLQFSLFRFLVLGCWLFLSEKENRNLPTCLNLWLVPETFVIFFFRNVSSCYFVQVWWFFCFCFFFGECSRYAWMGGQLIALGYFGNTFNPHLVFRRKAC